MACNKLRCGSGIVLCLVFTSWVIALGGLGTINWYVCSDTTKTLESLRAAALLKVAKAAGQLLAAGSLGGTIETGLVAAPVADEDNAVCSRSYRWEWWTLFFEFALVVPAIIVTILPDRLVRARFPLATLLSSASVLIMIAVNKNIGWVWYFYDTHKMFSEWEGILQRLYFSASALVAGWILVVIFNIIWIGFVLDHDATRAVKKDEEANEAQK